MELQTKLFLFKKQLDELLQDDVIIFDNRFQKNLFRLLLSPD